MKIFIFLFCMVSCYGVFSQKTITVAKDSSGDFKTVQAAINAIPSPNKVPITIIIKAGVYKETVKIDSGKNFITLKGDPKNKTLITFSNHEGSKLYNGDTLNIMNCATFLIYANDFHAENIHFENKAGHYAGPAVAVRAEGNRISFRKCLITGSRNVLFLSGSGVKHYFENCFIQGTTDFVCGTATAVFKKCRLHNKTNSHITAASTRSTIPFGFVFFDCDLTADDGLNNVSLGRPWAPNASVTYINCVMGKHIIAKGWNNWKNPLNEATARFAEYKSSGPGSNANGRVKWSRQLTDTEVKKYTLQNILGNWHPK